MGDWIGPDAPWPAHGGTHWDESLATAKAAGWWVYTFAGHSWGKVVCRRSPTDDRCELVIFSTGKGSETVARELAKKVTRCPHQGEGPEERPGRRSLQRAMEHVHHAERLISVVDRLHAAGDSEDRAQELLGYAVEQLEAGEQVLADDAFSEAGILETESHQLRTTARSELTDSEVTLDETGLVEAADTHLVAGSRALRRANPRWDGLSEILAKIEALRAQAEKLRHSTA